MRTDITLVLDRSGSMQNIRTDTIGGVNAFIEEQRKQPGDCAMSLVQFDDRYEPMYAGQAIAVAPMLTDANYIPRGSTALLDAIGRTINHTGARLAALPESERPAKVLFVIVTDGHENFSKEFTRDQVFKMITEQREKYSWDFVFLGANQDAIAVGGSLGISANSSMTYRADGKGARNAFTSTSRYASGVRASGGAAFTAADRDAQAS